MLSVLTDGPAYGYAISKRVATLSDGSLKLGPGRMYPLLSGMERAGLIVARWEEVRSARSEPGEAGRRRKWYELSPKGRQRLEQRVASHRAMVSLIGRFIGGAGAAEGGLGGGLGTGLGNGGGDGERLGDPGITGGRP